jgi:Zn-dependent protease with chaperone function
LTQFSRSWISRLIASGLCALLFFQAIPAQAMSTAQEIAAGAKENKAIDDQSVVIQDPFLTSWVNRIGSNLASHRQRRDIVYRFTIIDDQSINAFSIKGGFVHVNVGLLNLVSSDDELASTLGHEMGHVELHHVTKSDNASTIIGILETILSVIYMPAAILGSIGSDLAQEKYSRVDELQADKYGVSIMAQAGYDPQAAVDIMRALAAADPGPETRIEKAFIDHPVPADRIAHLLGYPQLDRVPPSDQVARAMHDESEGRYSYARGTLGAIASSNPGSISSTDQQRLDFALRESGALAAPDSRSSAATLTDFNARRDAALAALDRALQAQTAALDASKTAGRLGGLELSDLENKLESSAALAAAAQPPAPPQGTRSGAPAPDPSPQLAVIIPRDLNEIANLTDDVLQTAPGLANDERQTLEDMRSPLAEPGLPTPKYAALFPYYQPMTADLTTAATSYADSAAKARASIAAVAQALSGFDAAVAQLQSVPHNGSPSPDPHTMQRIRDAAGQFASDVDAALKIAQSAATEMYAGQTAALSTQISMLDLYSSPERYEAFRRALEFRFPGTNPPAYQQALALHVPAGELACDAWLAFEKNHVLSAVASPMASAGSPCIASALSDHLFAESMEIAEGLIFEDYDDAPSH